MKTPFRELRLHWGLVELVKAQGRLREGSTKVPRRHGAFTRPSWSLRGCSRRHHGRFVEPSWTFGATLSPTAIRQIMSGPAIAGQLCVCMFMFVWSSFSADWASTGGTLVKLLMISCPLPRMRLLSRELGSAVPSRASLLILHTKTYVAFTYGHPLLLPATVSIRPSLSLIHI